jgi:hypothetical protein
MAKETVTLSSLAREVRKGFKLVDARFDGLETFVHEKFAEIDKRFEQLEKRIERFHEVVEQFVEITTAMPEEFVFYDAQVKRRFADVEARLSKLEQKGT